MTNRLWKHLLAEARETARRPSRLLGLVDPPRVKRVAMRFVRSVQNARLESEWPAAAKEGEVAARSYRSYADYLDHQKRKLATVDLGTYQARFREALRERLSENLGLSPPGTVLCLGARLGAEVRAFHDLGHLAIGVDLNPGPENPYVLPGDFHELVFPDRCFDRVYTNTIDHVLDLGRLLAEIGRVLANDGRLLIEVPESSADGEYEVLTWQDLDSLLAEFGRLGWREARRTTFDYPWTGWQVELTRDARR